MSDPEKSSGSDWPSTHWSIVARAGTSSGVDQRQALVLLLERYLPAIRTHVLARGLARRDQVDDLIQEFLVSKILEQEILAKADKSRGKFRSFLVSTLDRFVMNFLRDLRAAKRSPDNFLPLEAHPDPIEHSPAPADPFDRAWARQLLGQAIRKMRAECRRAKRPDIWGVFNERVLTPCLRGGSGTPYAELVQRYQFESPGKATNILVTANRMFARVLRGVVAAYESDEADIDREIRDLWHAIADPRARSRRI